MSGQLLMDRPARIKTPDLAGSYRMKYNKNTNSSVDWNRLNNNRFTNIKYLQVCLRKCRKSICGSIKELIVLHKDYIGHNKLENVAKKWKDSLTRFNEIKQTLIRKANSVSNSNAYVNGEQADRVKDILNKTKDV